MANQWFRMYSEFSVDPKVQMLDEVDQRRLVMLFCIRCNGNVTLHDEEVTFLLRISNEEWLKTKAIIPGQAAQLRRAGYLAELGQQRLKAGDFDDPAALQPVYLRRPPITERKKP